MAEPLSGYPGKHLQAEEQSVEVTRAATGVEVSTRFDQGGERRATYSFTANGAPAALGFQVDADALAFTLEPIDAATIRRHPAWADLYREYAPQFYYACMAQDTRTHAVPSKLAGVGMVVAGHFGNVHLGGRRAECLALRCGCARGQSAQTVWRASFGHPLWQSLDTALRTATWPCIAHRAGFVA